MRKKKETRAAVIVAAAAAIVVCVIGIHAAGSAGKTGHATSTAEMSVIASGTESGMTEESAVSWDDLTSLPAGTQSVTEEDQEAEAIYKEAKAFSPEITNGDIVTEVNGPDRIKTNLYMYMKTTDETPDFVSRIDFTGTEEEDGESWYTLDVYEFGSVALRYLAHIDTEYGTVYFRPVTESGT